MVLDKSFSDLDWMNGLTRCTNLGQVSSPVPPRILSSSCLVHVRPWLLQEFPSSSRVLRQKPFGEWNRGVETIKGNISAFQKVGRLLKPCYHVFHYIENTRNLVLSWFSLGLSGIHHGQKRVGITQSIHWFEQESIFGRFVRVVLLEIDLYSHGICLVQSQKVIWCYMSCQVCIEGFKKLPEGSKSVILPSLCTRFFVIKYGDKIVKKHSNSG